MGFKMTGLDKLFVYLVKGPSPDIAEVNNKTLICFN